MPEIDTKTADTLMILRKSRHMSQSELARLSGICQSKISRLERGQRARAGELSRLLAILTAVF
jgi:transcriptional regulator with XRE-family HTH domain